MTPTGSTREVLVVGETGRARSPVLASLLRREAERRGLAGQVSVEDAGLQAQPGEPLLPSVAKAVRPLALDLEGHRARALASTPDLHDLVLTMTELQRRALVRERRSRLDVTFTVREAVRLLASARWDEAWQGTPQVVAHLHRLRPLVLGASGAEDVADPATGGRRVASAVVDELRWCSVRLATALWGPLPGPDTATGRSGQTPTVGR